MDVTKLYKFIGFGAMYVTKPYKFMGFGVMDVTKPYEFTGSLPPSLTSCGHVKHASSSAIAER